MFADQKQFFATIEQIAEEKGISRDAILETIGMAIAAAYKKEYGKRGQVVRAEYDPGTKSFRLYQVKLVVDESMLREEEGEEDSGTPDEIAAVASGDLAMTGQIGEKKIRFNSERHVMREEAETLEPGIAVGAELRMALPEHDAFGRIAAQTAKQVIIQRIREAERETIYRDYHARVGEIVSGVVQRIEGPNVFVDVGRLTALLPYEEQIPGERFSMGSRLRALLVSLEQTGRGLEARLSRAHPRFVELLFGIEVPEISQGNVEIKAIAREPGLRSKIAVASSAEGVDPVGSCVGQRGTRVMTVINELGGEKIDIIEFFEDPTLFIAKALSPAKVADVEIDEATRRADVVVPEDQVSLAIGRRGQNVRLAAKLTGWRIDIRGAAGEVVGSSEEAGTVSSVEPGAERMGDADEIGEQPISAGELGAERGVSSAMPEETSEAKTEVATEIKPEPAKGEVQS